MNQPATIDAELVYTPEQVGAHWHSSPDTVRRMLRNGVLRGFKVGDAWRVTGRALLEYEGVAVGELAGESHLRVVAS